MTFLHPSCWLRCAALGLVWLVWPALSAQAQTQPAVTTPGGGTAVRSYIEAPAVPPQPAAGPAAPPPSPDSAARCAAATDKANAADLKAFSAQAGKAEPQQLALLVDASIGAWQAAVESCDARARERAQRNLADSAKMRAGLADSQAAGRQCESTEKDAAALQGLAKQAVTERRWTDAAALFRKTEGLWELASERCNGGRQRAAAKLRDQAAVDGYNAESCNPQLESLNESSEKFHAASAALPRADRQQQSQAMEARWRELAKQCKGGVRDIAQAQADLLLNERDPPRLAGAPAGSLVAAPAVGPLAAPPSSPLAAPPSGPLAAASARPPPAPAALPLAALAPAPAAPANAGGTTGAAATTTTTGGAGSIDVTLADKTRLQGKFTRDSAGQSYSGVGRIEWANGDVYEGDVLHGLSHGRGEFTWPSGQSFKGEWVAGHAQGRGVMRFANGNLYEGQVVDGVPAGAGAMMYANGESYQGGFAAGLPEGEGVQTGAGLQRCQCTWVGGKATGRGQLRLANGDQYTGSLLEGVPHGEGELRYASGDVYKGGFDRGLMEGLGSFTWKSGDRYVGGWRRGLKEGPGIFTWADGTRWEGLYRADAQVEPPTSPAPPPVRR